MTKWLFYDIKISHLRAQTGPEICHFDNSEHIQPPFGDTPPRGKEYIMAIADIRDEIAKVAGEQFGRKFGNRIGGLAPLQKIGDGLRAMLGDDQIAHYGFSAGGIIAAALLHAPDELAARFTEMGYDGTKIQHWLNESIDAAVLSATSVIERGGNRGDALQQAVAKSFDEKKDAFEEIFKSECIINSYDRTIHHLHCPMCWRGDREQGKGDQKKKFTNFLEGCRKVPLDWAMKNGYAATTGACCGKSAADIVEKYAKPALTFHEAVMNIEKTFKDDAEKVALIDEYFGWLTSATRSEQKQLHDMQASKQWSPEIAVRVLQTVHSTPAPAPGDQPATKASRLITILKSFVKEKEEAIAVRGAKALQNFFTGEEDPNAERIRGQILAFAKERETAAYERDTRRLRAQTEQPRTGFRLPNWLAKIRSWL